MKLLAAIATTGLMASVIIVTAATASPPPQDRVASATNSINTIYTDLTADRTEALLNKDTIRSLCIADKLNTIDAARKQLTARSPLLKAALLHGDTEAAEHEATIAEEILRKTQTLASAAKVCHGNDLLKISEDQTTKVEIDSSLPEETTSYPIPPTTLEPPACSSCFK